MKKLSYTLLGLAFVASAAQAQQAADTTAEAPAADAAAPAADAAAPAAEAAAPAADASATSYTDAEIDSFAKATVKVQAINADTALDQTEKQAQMAAAVTEAGLDPAKYNEMGQALTSDDALRTKVQTAMAQHVTPTEG